MIRKNEYLTREIQKQSQLLALYEEYLQQLEKLVKSTSAIKFQIKKLKSKVKSRNPSKKKSKKRKIIRKKIIRRKSKTKKKKRKSKRRR